MSALARRDDEETAELEQRALERMVGALCEDIDGLVAGTDTRASRETDLQAQAYAERRAQAMALLETPRGEPHEIRITRLEKAVEALTRSREYFRGG